MITIAVDCMGGDHGSKVTLPACRQFLEQHADASLILVGLLLCVCLLVDRKVYPSLGLSGWLPMRLHLTAVAGMCCLVSAAKLA